VITTFLRRGGYSVFQIRQLANANIQELIWAAKIGVCSVFQKILSNYFLS